MLSSTCAHSSRLKDSDLNYHIEAALPACKKKKKCMIHWQLLIYAKQCNRPQMSVLCTRGFLVARGRCDPCKHSAQGRSINVPALGIGISASFYRSKIRK